MALYTTSQLEHALKLQRTIESHQRKIASLTGKLEKVFRGNGAGMPSPFNVKKDLKKGKRKMSAAGRAKIAAAAKKRWAKAKAAGKSRL